MISVDLNQRQIGFFVDADHFAAKAFAAQQAYGDSRGPLDHMIVRQDVAVRIDNESTAYSACRPRKLAAIQIIKRTLRCAIALVVVIALGNLARGLQSVDVHDRGLNAASHFDERC